MNMQELMDTVRKQEYDDAFGGIITIDELQMLTGLSATAIYNAIWRDKLICKKVGSKDGQKGGQWIISLKSAQAVWPKRFAAQLVEKAI